MSVRARFTTVHYTVETIDGVSHPVYDPCDEHGAPEFYADITEEFDTIPELAKAIREFGCTTCAGASWFYSPDGSRHIVYYGTGEQEEPAVFLVSELKPRQLERLIDLVTKD